MSLSWQASICRWPARRPPWATSSRPRSLPGRGFNSHTQTHFQNGDWVAAAASWRQYLTMAQEVPAWVEQARGMLAFLQGDVPEALGGAEKFIPHAERRREGTSIVLAVDWCAFLYLRMQRLREARQLLAGALERFTSI